MALLVDSIKEYVFYRFNKINMIIKEKYYFDPIKFKNVNIDDERLLMNSEIKKIMRKHNEDNYYKKLYIELMFKNVKKFNNNLKYFLYRLDCNEIRNMIKTTYCNICRCGYLLIAKYILKFKLQKWGHEYTITIYSLICACFSKKKEIIKWLLTDDTIAEKLGHSIDIMLCIYAMGSIKIHKLVSKKAKCLENIDDFIGYFEYFDIYGVVMRYNYYIYPLLGKDNSIFDNYKYFKWVMKRIIKKNKIYDSQFYRIYGYALKFCENIKSLKWLTSKFCVYVERNKSREIDKPIFGKRLNDMDEINKKYYIDPLQLRCIFQTLNTHLNNQNKYNISCKNKNWSNTITKNNNSGINKDISDKNKSDENNLIISLINSLKYCNSYNIKFIIGLCNNYHQEITIQQYNNIIEYSKYNTNKNKAIKIIKLLIKKLNLDVKILFSIAFNESAKYIYLWLYKKYNLSQDSFNNLFYEKIWGSSCDTYNKLFVGNKNNYAKINVDRRKIMKIFNEKIKGGNIINYYMAPLLYASGIINFGDITKILYKKIEIERSKRWSRMEWEFDKSNVQGWFDSISNLSNNLTIKENKLLDFLRYKRSCNYEGAELLII